MNKDALINKIANAVGCSRKEVITTLKQFGMLGGKSVPQVKKDS